MYHQCSQINICWSTKVLLPDKPDGWTLFNTGHEAPNSSSVHLTLTSSLMWLCHQRMPVCIPTAKAPSPHSTADLWTSPFWGEVLLLQLCFPDKVLSRSDCTSRCFPWKRPSPPPPQLLRTFQVWDEGVWLKIRYRHIWRILSSQLPWS